MVNPAVQEKTTEVYTRLAYHAVLNSGPTNSAANRRCTKRAFFLSQVVLSIGLILELKHCHIMLFVGTAHSVETKCLVPFNQFNSVSRSYLLGIIKFVVLIIAMHRIMSHPICEEFLPSALMLFYTDVEQVAAPVVV